MISAGFDSCEGDPLGRFRLTDDDFAELTRIVLAIAREHAGGRVISVLEGGYDLYGLATASVAHVRALRAD
jgi:acetoin utilization deacetylase AcuC-like enzyme